MFDRLKRIFDPGPSTHAAEFWQWFGVNESVYRRLASQSDAEVAHSLKVFADHLRPYEPDLRPLFGRLADGRRELIITAGGRTELFEAADALVAAAPEIAGWSVVSLKPPHPKPSALEVEGISFAPETTTFAVIRVPEEPDALAVHVFHEPYGADQQRVHELGTFLLLEMVLGERSTGRDLRHVETHPISDQVPASVLRPLLTLPDVIRRHRAQTARV